MKKMPYSLEWDHWDISKIILNTTKEISKIKIMLNETTFGLLSEDKIYDTVIDALTYESVALYELPYALHYDYGNFGHYFSDERMVKTFIDEVVELGRSIHEQLMDLGLYQNGVINYRYGYLAGRDLVLYSNEYYINHVAIPNIMECQ